MARVPAVRISTAAPERDVRHDGDFVLYWMIAQRRRQANFALQRAVEWARELGRPLVVLEALRCGYPWASERFHRFIIDGMADNAEAFDGSPVLYHPYLEEGCGEGKGLLAALGSHACVVVTDDYPAYFLPRMAAAAARQIAVRMELVDANGLLPLRAAGRTFATAFAFRRHLQREIPAHLGSMPSVDPLARVELARLASLPPAIERRWPAAPRALLARPEPLLARLPIDHDVAPVSRRGGARAARATLRDFVRDRLGAYADERNHPDVRATSELSPYLHFGHIGAHEVFAAVSQAAGLHAERLAARRATGARRGFWGLDANAEAFLDQLVTWRELGFNMCATRDDYDRYASLPEWARTTLAEHAGDPRPHVYDLDAFAAARTHDPLWNAAQRQLRRDGVMHNYLRMLWGKKIIEWSPTPESALAAMIELNNRYALDGRDPNSTSGIFWILGRYDRPWGPERPIFGKVRYMSSANTARKLRLRDYLEHYAG